MQRFFRSAVGGTLAGILFLISSWVTPSITAQEATDSADLDEPIVVSVFERDDCKHCQDQKDFLESLAEERDDFVVQSIDIRSPENFLKWEQVTTGKEISKATPITVINGRLIQGFAEPETTGQMIISMIDDAVAASPRISLEEFLESDSDGSIQQVEDGQCEEECTIEPEPYLVTIPFLGVTDVKQYSLPVLAALLGFVDGFNPCAMWVLVSFIMILIQVGDRRKMWTFAGIFILAEAIMYFLILNVWFTAWDFVGLDRIITPIVGLVAVGAGAYFLYEAINSDGTCKVTNLEQRAKTRNTLQKLAAAKFGIATFIGILGLAFSVNIIEFACSIGIPQAFTKILELNGLNFVGSLPYTLLYILMYMIDDLIVFGIALYSIEKIGLTTKYTRITQVIGGIVMLVLGVILLLAPDLLRVL